jgi:AmmeMemoRadiSam system protein A
MNSAPQDAGQVLLPLARRSIERALHGTAARPPGDPAWLLAPGACRVSLNLAGRERGAALSHAPARPLGEDVARNAVAAALRDPRHAPVSAGELAAARLEVALFAQWLRIAAGDEPAALARLRPGEDAVFFRYGRHRSMFLPAQWAEYPEPAEFIAHLKYRAGLPPDFWDPGIELARSRVLAWRE